MMTFQIALVTYVMHRELQKIDCTNHVRHSPVKYKAKCMTPVIMNRVDWQNALLYPFDGLLILSSGPSFSRSLYWSTLSYNGSFVWASLFLSRALWYRSQRQKRIRRGWLSVDFRYRKRMKTTMHILVMSIKRLDFVVLRPYLDILEVMMTAFPLSIVAYMTGDV